MNSRPYHRWLSRPPIRSRFLEVLEPRVLLTAVYANPDIAGTWALDTAGQITAAVNAANHAPTLTKISPLATAIDNMPFTISYDTLLAASNAADSDHDPISFQVTAVGASGTLALNAQPLGTLPATVAAGDILTWTPGPNANGTLTAFSVTAFDGTTPSAKPVAVKIKSALFPAVSITTSKSTANEGGNGNSGTAMFLVSRANGDKTQPLTVHYTIGGTAQNGVNYNPATPLSGTVIIPANKPNVTISIQSVDDGTATGDLTVLLTLVADANYGLTSKSSATVTIKDAAPIVTVVASRPTAPEANNSSSGQFTISRSGDTSQSLFVSFTLAGTAIRGPDYYISGASPTGITLPAHAKSASFTVVANNNHVHDVPNLAILLTLDTDPAYQVSPLKPSATISILEA